MAKKIGNKLAKRYANAFLVALDKHCAETFPADDAGRVSFIRETAAQLEEFANLWEENAELSGSVLNPMFDARARLQALEKVCELAQLREILGKFIRTVFERERISILPDIAVSFTELADDRLGRVQVEVSTARDVSGKEKAEIETKLSQKISGTASFTWNINAELLGGLVVKYGGRVIDGSLAGQLSRMENALMGAGVK